MRIVIVGASGNIGTALLRNLSTHPVINEIVGVSRRTPPAEPPYSSATWSSVDISAAEASEKLTGVFAGADAVVNLAWGFQPTRDAAQLERVGVGGTTAVADAVIRAGVPHLVHMSSVGAYRAAENGRRVDENWPTDGVPTSVYSRHKAAAERVLDRIAADHRDLLITRFRPGLVMQRAAGSSLLRYGVPGYVPARLIQLLPVLPLDRKLTVPVVHANDVAAAISAAIEQRRGGAFNLAAEPGITRNDIAAALRAYPVQVPERVLRPIVDLTWRLRLQRIDAGWIDLAFAAPLMDTTMARTELGWAPTIDARSALREVISGIADAANTNSPVLRRRTVRNQLADLVRSGPITARQFS
jgi:nucleoside-diphosphate-sugar epimerase